MRSGAPTEPPTTNLTPAYAGLAAVVAMVVAAGSTGIDACVVLGDQDDLSEADAERYFRVAVYGDPVEVSGTRIALSEADGDIYDWIFDWETWQGMSVKQTL